MKFQIFKDKKIIFFEKILLTSNKDHKSQKISFTLKEFEEKKNLGFEIRLIFQTTKTIPSISFHFTYTDNPLKYKIVFSH